MTVIDSLMYENLYSNVPVQPACIQHVCISVVIVGVFVKVFSARRITITMLCTMH